MERIQKSMHHLIKEFRPLNYRQKLKKVKLLTLESRRIQDQLTVMHEMKFYNIHLDFNIFFWKANVRRRKVMHFS